MSFQQPSLSSAYGPGFFASSAWYQNGNNNGNGNGNSNGNLRRISKRNFSDHGLADYGLNGQAPVAYPPDYFLRAAGPGAYQANYNLGPQPTRLIMVPAHAGPYAGQNALQAAPGHRYPASNSSSLPQQIPQQTPAPQTSTPLMLPLPYNHGNTNPNSHVLQFHPSPPRYYGGGGFFEGPQHQVELPRRAHRDASGYTSNLLGDSFAPFANTFADDFEKLLSGGGKSPPLHRNTSAAAASNPRGRPNRSKELLLLSSSTPVKRLISGEDLDEDVEGEEEEGNNSVDISKLMKFDEMLSFGEDADASTSEEDVDSVDALPAHQPTMATIIVSKHNHNHLPLPSRNYRKASVDFPLHQSNSSTSNGNGKLISRILNSSINGNSNTVFTPSRKTRAASISLDGTDYARHHLHRSGSSSSSSGSSISGKSSFKEQLYKTELCRNMTELGSCEFGDECYFAHSEAEKRQADARKLHPNHRTVHCIEWNRGNVCKFGRRCAFIHRPPTTGFAVDGESSELSETLWNALLTGGRFEPRQF